MSLMWASAITPTVIRCPHTNYKKGKIRMSKTQNPPTQSDDDGWEEKGQDNGDLIAWKAGERHQGVFIGRREVELPVSEQNPEGGSAEMLIFENRENGAQSRWSTWLTYQLREAFEDIDEGTECRITCTGERKAKIGNVKIFSIKTRSYQQPTLPIEPF